MAILDVQDIHTYYGDAYVLQGLSLQLEQGHILGLLGRNGVGKTTLVNSIVGFNPPSATAGICSASTNYFRACMNAVTSEPRHSRAASSKCWRSAAG